MNDRDLFALDDVCSILSYVFIVLADRNNIPRIDMSLHGGKYFMMAEY
jgi:hypothetical protein